MKGGVFNRPECCNQPCECPVCFEEKPLMRLNCNHYVCLEDIEHILNLSPRSLQKCPICRKLIDSYGCNGNIINVQTHQLTMQNLHAHQEFFLPHTTPPDLGYDSDHDYDSFFSDSNSNSSYGFEGGKSRWLIKSYYSNKLRGTNQRGTNKKRNRTKKRKLTLRRKSIKRRLQSKSKI